MNILLEEKEQEEYARESYNRPQHIIHKENNKKTYQLKYSKNKINLYNISRIYMNLLPKRK